MANQYLNMYKDNPTMGAVDGTVVSTEGILAAPVMVSLDANIAEEKTIKLAMRCENGYAAPGGVVLTLDGTHKSRWSLCSTIDGTYADTLTLPAVHSTNVVFYAKAKADSELPANDITVSIVSTANIKAEV